ncbi:hypothetical protein [Streptomyces lydicus]
MRSTAAVDRRSSSNPYSRGLLASGTLGAGEKPEPLRALDRTARVAPL